MTKEELEKKLQESADQTEIREFSEVWAEIKDQVEAPKKKFPWKRLIPIAASVVLVAASAIILPIALQEQPTDEPPVLYLDDDLTEVPASQTEFYQAINDAQLDLIDWSALIDEAWSISRNEEGEVKGGKLDLVLLSDMGELSAYFTLTFYDKDVEVSEYNNIVYTHNYTTASGVVLEYMSGEETEYHAKAEYQSVQYLIDFSELNIEITDFFEDFFQ